MPEWVWPNGSKTMPRINSPYGWRVHPVYGTRRMHYGVDFSHTFTYNCAITDGTVIKVGYVPGWYGGGYGIWVDNWDGSLAKYFHGVDGSALVRVGQKVTARQRLSRVGMSGTATGVHCHLELSPNGGANSQVNPVPFLKARIAATAGGGSTPFDPAPEPEPEEEEDDMYKPTVHIRTEGPFEATLAHPGIGTDLEQHTGPGTGETRTDGKVTVYRGFMVTADRDIATAWARTHAKGSGNETSQTDRDGYIAIQVEASRVAVELA